ncbi:MAG: hypothetical protein M1387_05210 [Thaumarchaeota archaeon]|nr:hypothetical protein [Nitrososphaerota archaeon]
MKRTIAAILIVSLVLTIFPQMPLTSALSQISIYADKPIYVAGDSVYIYGKIPEPPDTSAPVKITVANPSGGEWSSVSLTLDPAGDFGATVGTISSLDSTGTYVVTVHYLGLSNRTAFQVKTPSRLTLNSSKLVYLVGETISVAGTVSPLIEGYRVTLRLGTNATCSDQCTAVGQITPKPDGTFAQPNFYKVRSIDNGHWFINATYGPFSSAVVDVYVGVKVTVSISSQGYVPGRSVDISGVVSPMISGPVAVAVKNPSGSIWFTDSATPSANGTFSVRAVPFPGDQVGNYSVTASYWGVSGNANFTLGRLGSSTMRITTAGVFDINDKPAPWLYSGSMVRVRAIIVNDDVVSHNFTFITQIKDISGNLVFMGGQSSLVEVNGFVGQTIGQRFSERGTYIVEVFVWDSWIGGNALSEVRTLTFQII